MKKYFAIVLISISFLCSYNIVFANTYWTDNFDSYSTGSIDGLGFWTVNSGSGLVSEDVAQSGTKSYKGINGESVFEPSVSLNNDGGSLEFYLRVGSVGGGDTFRILFRDTDPSLQNVCSVGIFGTDIKVNDFDASSESIGTASVDTWYKIRVDFDGTDCDFYLDDTYKTSKTTLEGDEITRMYVVDWVSSYGYLDSIDFDSDTTTRFITYTPEQDSTVATSSSFTYGVSGYISEEDFTENSFVRMRLSNLTQEGLNFSQTAGFAGWFIGDEERIEYEFPIYTSGAFDVSTTTELELIGRYQVDVDLIAPSFDWWFISIGETTLLSETYYFTASTTTWFDDYTTTIGEQLSELFSATTTAECNISLTGILDKDNLKSCVFYLYAWSGDSITAVLGDYLDDFLYRVPWGYATRIYNIITTTSASTTPPNLTMTLPEGMAGTGSSLDLTPWDDIQNTVALIDTYDGVDDGDSMWDTIIYYYNACWYVLFAVWCWRKVQYTFF